VSWVITYSVVLWTLTSEPTNEWAVLIVALAIRILNDASLFVSTGREHHKVGDQSLHEWHNGDNKPYVVPIEPVRSVKIEYMTSGNHAMIDDREPREPCSISLPPYTYTRRGRLTVVIHKLREPAILGHKEMVFPCHRKDGRAERCEQYKPLKHEHLHGHTYSFDGHYSDLQR
jgi:hypothetical protein